MRFDRAPVTALLVLAALAAIQAVHYYPQLPDTLATHFGPNGEPNGWSEKGPFVLTYSIIEALVVGFGLALAFMLERIPAWMVNIPHRDYWMAPERRRETAEFLGNQILWIEAATLLFLMAVTQLIYVKNLGDAPPRFSGDFWYILGAFVAATLWLTVRIILRFRKREPEGPVGV